MTGTLVDLLTREERAKARSIPTNKWCYTCGLDWWNELDRLSHLVNSGRNWVCPLEVMKSEGH